MEEIIFTAPYRLLVENVTHGREGFTEEDLTDVATSWQPIWMAFILTAIQTIGFLSVYEWGRRNKYVNTVYDRRRAKYPSRVPAPLIQNRGCAKGWLSFEWWRVRLTDEDYQKDSWDEYRLIKMEGEVIKQSELRLAGEEIDLYLTAAENQCYRESPFFSVPPVTTETLSISAQSSSRLLMPSAPRRISAKKPDATFEPLVDHSSNKDYAKSSSHSYSSYTSGVSAAHSFISSDDDDEFRSDDGNSDSGRAAGAESGNESSHHKTTIFRDKQTEHSTAATAPDDSSPDYGYDSSEIPAVKNDTTDYDYGYNSQPSIYNTQQPSAGGGPIDHGFVSQKGLAQKLGYVLPKQASPTLGSATQQSPPSEASKPVPDYGYNLDNLTQSTDNAHNCHRSTMVAQDDTETDYGQNEKGANQETGYGYNDDEQDTIKYGAPGRSGMKQQNSNQRLSKLRTEKNSEDRPGVDAAQSDYRSFPTRRDTTQRNDTQQTKGAHGGHDSGNYENGNPSSESASEAAHSRLDLSPSPASMEITRARSDDRRINRVGTSSTSIAGSSRGHGSHASLTVSSRLTLFTGHVDVVDVTPSCTGMQHRHVHVQNLEMVVDDDDCHEFEENIGRKRNYEIDIGESTLPSHMDTRIEDDLEHGKVKDVEEAPSFEINLEIRVPLQQMDTASDTLVRPNSIDIHASSDMESKVEPENNNDSMRGRGRISNVQVSAHSARTRRSGRSSKSIERRRKLEEEIKRLDEALEMERNKKNHLENQQQLEQKEEPSGNPFLVAPRADNVGTGNNQFHSSFNLENILGNVSGGPSKTGNTSSSHGFNLDSILGNVSHQKVELVDEAQTAADIYGYGTVEEKQEKDEYRDNTAIVGGDSDADEDQKDGYSAKPNLEYGYNTAPRVELSKELSTEELYGYETTFQEKEEQYSSKLVPMKTEDEDRGPLKRTRRAKSSSDTGPYDYGYEDVERPVAKDVDDAEDGIDAFIPTRRSSGQHVQDRRSSGGHLPNRRSSGQHVANRRSSGDHAIDRRYSGDGFPNRRSSGQHNTGRRSSGGHAIRRKTNEYGSRKVSMTTGDLADLPGVITDRAASMAGFVKNRVLMINDDSDSECDQQTSSFVATKVVRRRLDPEDQELLRCIGLDAFMTLRFLHFGFDVSFWPMLLSLVTLIPLYKTEQGPVEGFYSATVVALNDGSWRFWFVMLFGVLHYLYILRRLWIEWEVFLPLRYEFLENGDFEKEKYKEQYRKTCLVEYIPKAQKHDQALYDFFDAVFPGKIRRAEVLLNTEHLTSLIRERQMHIVGYEDVYAKKVHKKAKYMREVDKYEQAKKRTCCCRKKKPPIERPEPMVKIKHPATQKRTSVPALKWHYDNIYRLNKEIEEEYMRLAQAQRRAVTQSANESRIIKWLGLKYLIGSDTGRLHSSTAFVQFKTLAAKQQAIQCNITGMNNYMVVEPVPEVRDLIWDNMHISRALIETRKFWANIAFGGGLVLWSIVVSFIRKDRDLSSHIDSPLTQDAAVKSFVNVYVPALVVEGLVRSLPRVFNVAVLWIRFKSHSEQDHYILNWYFYYRLVTFVFIIVGSKLHESTEDFVQNPIGYLKKLSGEVTVTSKFFMSYVVVTGGMQVFFRLSQWHNLALYWIMVSWQKEESLSQRRIQTFNTTIKTFHLDEFIPLFIFIFMIGALYGALVPLSGLIVALFFRVAYKVFRYMTLFIYGARYEGGGFLFYSLSDTVFNILAMIQAVVAAYLGANGGGVVAIFFAITIFINIMVRRDVQRTFVIPSKTLSLNKARASDESQDKRSLKERKFDEYVEARKAYEKAKKEQNEMDSSDVDPSRKALFRPLLPRVDSSEFSLESMESPPPVAPTRRGKKRDTTRRLSAVELFNIRYNEEQLLEEFDEENQAKKDTNNEASDFFIYRQPSLNKATWETTPKPYREGLEREEAAEVWADVRPEQVRKTARARRASIAMCYGS